MNKSESPKNANQSLCFDTESSLLIFFGIRSMTKKSFNIKYRLVPKRSLSPCFA